MAGYKGKNSKIVYSTDGGRFCPLCDKPRTGCTCNDQNSPPPGDGIVRVGRETKGRKGKGVTTISGIPLDHSGLQALAKELKKRCGTGGTIKESRLEIQGDHRDMLIEELRKRGWQVKRCGG